MRLLSSVAAVLVTPLILTTGDLPSTEKTSPQPMSDGPTSQTVAAAEPMTEDVPKIIKVEAGDTLIKIADKNATTYSRIFNANPSIEHPDLIHPGDEIRIPNADEQLADRPLPAATALTEATKPRVIPKPRAPVPKPTQTASGGSVWDRLAQCESGGNWSINSGNGYYGGLQFTLSTWRGVGGSDYPHQASREEQIARAEILLTRSGWGNWPACATKLGLL